MIKTLLRFRSNKIGENNKHMLSIKTLNFSLLFALLAFSNLYAQAPGAPHVTAPDVTMSCSDESVMISAEYLEIGETNSGIYNVEAVEYAPPFPFTGGTQVSVGQDDIWSGNIDLPFSFCYFGAIEDIANIGSNGILSFKDYGAGDYSTYVLGANEQLPSSSVHNNAIMLYHDMDPRYGESNINYQLIGEAPARTMVLSFSKVPYYNSTNTDNTATSTFQIVIYETTNVIEFYVYSKPDVNDPQYGGGFSINNGRAVLGIQNDGGTTAYTAEDRNTSIWAASKEAWRFTPAGEDVFEFWWEDSDGVEFSRDDTVEVFPTSPDDYYTAVIEYTNCTGDVIRLEDRVNLNIEPDFTVDLGRNRTICAVDSYVLEPVIDPMPTQEITYLWSTGETTPTIEVSESGIYSVTVSIDGRLGACGTSDEVEIVMNDYPMIDLGEDIETCFNEDYITLDASPSNMDVNDVSFVWYFNGTEIDGATESTFTADELGVYGVSVDSNDCTTYEEIEILPGQDLFVDLGEDIKTCGGTEITLDAQTDEEGASFSWYLNDELITGETSNSLTITTREVSNPDIYKVVIETAVCAGFDEIEVGTYDVGNCTISEGISPDGSAGFNDSLDLEFLADRSGIKKLQIFNRLGTLVFKQDNYVNEWKGQSDSDDELPSGTYYYVIDLEKNDSEYGKQATGWIYLNR